MGMISDVTSFEVEGQSPVSTGVTSPTINISVEPTPSLTVSTQTYAVGTIDVQVAGPQGAPGVKNVYVQPNSPAEEFGWGMDEKDYVWIRTT